ERREDPLLDPVHGHRVRHVGAGELGGRIVGGEVDREGLARTRFESGELLIESRRVGGGPQLHADAAMKVFFDSGGPWGPRLRRGVRFPPLEIDQGSVAVLEAAAFDRLEAGATLSQSHERLVDGIVFNPARKTPERDAPRSSRSSADSTTSLGISSRTFLRVSLTSTNSVFMCRDDCGPPSRLRRYGGHSFASGCLHSEARAQIPASEGVRKEGVEPSWLLTTGS